MKPLDHFQILPGLPGEQPQRMVEESQFMKMLFFSADKSEVDQVRREFDQAGIPSEVRTGLARRGTSPDLELWIKNERDCHRAFTLCVQLGIGFAKRAGQPVEVEA